MFVYDRIKSVLPLLGGVADLGCGAGEELFPFKKADVYHPLVGFDLIDHGKQFDDLWETEWHQRMPGDIEVRPNIDLVFGPEGDIRTADLGEGRFSVIMAISSLHFLDDVDFEIVVLKVVQALQEGGLLVVSSYHEASESRGVDHYPLDRWRYDILLKHFNVLHELSDNPFNGYRGQNAYFVLRR